MLIFVRPALVVALALLPTLAASQAASPAPPARSKPAPKPSPQPTPPREPGRETLLAQAAPACDNALTLVEAPAIIGGPALLVLRASEETTWSYLPELQPSPKETVPASAVKAVLCVKETVIKEKEKYNDGAEAFSRDWDVRILRWPEATLVRTHTIHFGAPYLKKGNGPGIAARPIEMPPLYLDSPAILTHLPFEARLWGFALAPIRGMLASSSRNSIALFDAAGTAPARKIDPALGNYDSVGAVAFSPDGKTLAAAVSEKKKKYESRTPCLSLWSVDTGKELAGSKTCHLDSIRELVFSPDGRLVASVGGDKKVKLWDAASARELRMLEGPSPGNAIRSVAFSPDGGTLASVGERGLALWDAGTGTQRATLGSESDRELRSTWAVAFSPDGKTLASGHEGKQKDEGGYLGVTDLWDVASSRKVRMLPNDGVVKAVAFSPDGKMLAAGTGQPAIELWEVATGKRVGRLTGHVRAVAIVAFSADGKKLLSVAEGGALDTWDVAAATGQAQP